MKNKLEKLLKVTGLSIWPTEKSDETFTEIDDPSRHSFRAFEGPFTVERIQLRARWPLGAKVRVTIELLDGRKKQRREERRA